MSSNYIFYELCTSAGKMPNHPHDRSANYTGRRQAIEMLIFQIANLFCRMAMWESNLFDLSHGLWKRV